MMYMFVLSYLGSIEVTVWVLGVQLALYKVTIMMYVFVLSHLGSTEVTVNDCGF